MITLKNKQFSLLTFFENSDQFWPSASFGPFFGPRSGQNELCTYLYTY